MTERGKPPGSLDPVELWKQWYETSSREWSKALEGSNETFVDTYGFYQIWLKTLGKAQEQMQARALETMNPKELWNAWFEATVGAWKKASQMGGDPLGLTTQWLEMMEETRKRIMTSSTLPADPATFFREWYEATSGTWARVVDDVISSEKFMESASPFLEVYANFVKTLRRSNEEYFKNLQLPTRSDLARVAGLVVTLEEKVDKIEDTFESIEEGYARVATREAVGGLEGHLGQVENKLDTLAAALKKNEAVQSLDGRLERVENKLHTLSASLEKSERAETVAELTKRLDTVESKLDKVLTALENIADSDEAQQPEPDNVRPIRRVHRKKSQ